MKRKIGYSEPIDYFPKEIRDKYFKTDKPKTENTNKKTSEKSKGAKK